MEVGGWRECFVCVNCVATPWVGGWVGGGWVGEWVGGWFTSVQGVKGLMRASALNL